MTGNSAAGSAGQVCAQIMVELLLLLLFCRICVYTYCDGIVVIVTVVILLKVSRELFIQNRSLLCKAQVSRW